MKISVLFSYLLLALVLINCKSQNEVANEVKTIENSETKRALAIVEFDFNSDYRLIECKTINELETVQINPSQLDTMKNCENLLGEGRSLSMSDLQRAERNLNMDRLVYDSWGLATGAVAAMVTVGVIVNAVVCVGSVGAACPAIVTGTMAVVGSATGVGITEMIRSETHNSIKGEISTYGQIHRNVKNVDYNSVKRALISLFPDK